MVNPQLVEQIAQAVVARIMPYLQNGHGGNGHDPKRGSLALVPPIRKLLTVEEAAIYLGRYRAERDGTRKPSTSAIYHLVARGEIPVVRHGRNLRFELKSLDEWVMRDRV